MKTEFQNAFWTSETAFFLFFVEPTKPSDRDAKFTGNVRLSSPKRSDDVPAARWRDNFVVATEKKKLSLVGSYENASGV